MSLLRYFHPVLPSKKLGKKPLAAQIGEEAIVLYRTSAGEPAALKDRCPHRFTPLSAGSVNSQGHITCPYHGWHFDEKGEGAKPGDNGKCRVHSYQVMEKYGYIWVAERTADAAKIPNLDEEGYVLLESYDFTFKAPFHVVLDNFSEDEHFPFVHSMFGWDETQLDRVEHSSKQVGNRIEVNYWGPQRTFFGMSLLLAKPGQYFENRWIQEYDPVCFTYRANLTDAQRNVVSPAHNKVVIYFVPIGSGETKLHVFQFAKFRSKFWYKILPVIKPTYVGLVKVDIRNDLALTEKLQKVPYELKGMALGKYDEPIKLGRVLLDKVYFARGSGAPEERGAEIHP